jgi:2-oxoisovalerate dehydrogenase E1 component alpha subunit
MKTVAEFSVKYQQILDSRGDLVSALPAFAADVTELVRMYRMMSLVRLMDTKAVNLQRTGKLGTYASCLGHEATHVGAGAAMRPEDVLAPVYREYGAQLWRGVAISEVLLYWGGDERGNDFAGPRQDFAWCVPIATQALHAAGAAMAFKLRGEKRCAVGFIGDGGTSEGAFYEALNLAGARQLPVVFIIVNNGYAISLPLAEQTAATTLAQKGIAAGVPSIQVDGNDALAVRQVVGDALDVARSGGGPALIEAITYRLSDHTTADDAGRYRPADEVKQAWLVEPLVRLRSYLTRTGAWSAQAEQALQQEGSALVEAQVALYLGTPKQSTDTMFDYLFAETPRHLIEQREMARRYPNPGGGH